MSRVGSELPWHILHSNWLLVLDVRVRSTYPSLTVACSTRMLALASFCLLPAFVVEQLDQLSLCLELEAVRTLHTADFQLPGMDPPHPRSFPDSSHDLDSTSSIQSPNQLRILAVVHNSCTSLSVWAVKRFHSHHVLQEISNLVMKLPNLRRVQC